MKKNLLLFMISFMFIGLSMKSNAQVRGISYILSPTAEYAWTHEHSGLDDGFMIGGQLGFGFGQNVELAAVYLQGLDLTTSEDKFNHSFTDFRGRSVDFRRYGGELKLNLSRSALKPYISIGTGIQDIGLEDGDRYSHIYTTGGLGLKVTAADRYTLAVQGNTNYVNMNPTRALLTAEDRADNNINLDETENELYNNYSLRASLLIHIGGRDPKSITDIDEAYWDNFSSGFRGLSIPFEPTVMKVNFHESLPYRDAYFAGGSLGFDFGPFIGVRGFYYQALEDGEYTKFDKLAMYGGEAKFKLNEGNGFVPSILIGGGNIDARNTYEDVNEQSNLGDKAFASGGLGLDIPFSKYFKASGYVKALLTSGMAEVDDIPQPDDINTSWAYGVSLNFIFGKSSRRPNVVRQSTFDEYMTTQEGLRSEYDNKIDSLNLRLQEAMVKNDAREVEKIRKEKESAEIVKDRLDENAADAMKDRIAKLEGEKDGNYRGSSNVGRMGRSESIIQMTPAEFNLLIRDILDARKDDMNMRHQMRMDKLQGSNDRSDVEKLREEIKRDQMRDELASAMTAMKTQLASMDQKMNNLKDENEKLRRESKEQAAINARDAVRNEEMDMLMTELQKNRAAMQEMKLNQAMNLNEVKDAQVKEAVAAYTKAMEVQLAEANKKIMDLNREVTTLKTQQPTKVEVVVEREEPTVVEKDVIVEQKSMTSNSTTARLTDLNYDDTKAGFFPSLRYRGMSGFAGFSLGGSATFNIGYRLHYGVKNRPNVELMPETFFGFGSPSSFGISLNGIYKIAALNQGQWVKPYVGAGLGLLKVGNDENEDKIKGGVNLILGTSLNVANGDLYVDYTTRNFFDYNQLIVGYRFPF